MPRRRAHGRPHAPPPGQEHRRLLTALLSLASGLRLLTRRWYMRGWQAQDAADRTRGGTPQRTGRRGGQGEGKGGAGKAATPLLLASKLHSSRQSSHDHRWHLGCILPSAPKQCRCGQVARLEAELRGRVAACKSFSEVLQVLCGVSAVNGGKDELGRAYKKALAKHHP